MTRFSDPVVVLHDLAVLKYFWHTTNGIYIWEYLTTLDFELDVIRGRRPYRWTIWIYSLTRVCTLTAIVLSFVALDTTTPINCQVWITFQLTFAFLGLAAASLLIISRIDIVLLLIVLIGLLRLLHDSGGTFALGRLLWKQGVIWLLIATVAEVPPTVFIVLNLNASFNLMSQLPSLIAMAIAATRIYRNLADFAYGSTDIAFDSLQIRDGKFTRAKWKPFTPTPVNQIEVIVDTCCERHSTAQSIISMDGQLGDKPHGSSP
ncbi:hypothetical protein F5888DRAFT_1906889 [Russula emetica]|nr:hypothetical protein F5888DRAFT_1906889 [Russula emetica]